MCLAALCPGLHISALEECPIAASSLWATTHDPELGKTLDDSLASVQVRAHCPTSLTGRALYIIYLPVPYQAEVDLGTCPIIVSTH